MKVSFKSIKRTSLVLFFFFMSLSSYAAGPVAVVNSVKGRVFLTVDGKTVTLRSGDHVPDFAEIMTSNGAQVTFSDYHDHQYHLSGSGHLRILNKIIELKSGYLWFQAWAENGNNRIQTANAELIYNKGEGIASFDPYSGKSQVLVIKGNYEFMNLLDRMRATEVRDGQFTFIQNDFEMGTPRHPTPIGYSSFKKVTSLFSGVEPMDKDAGERMKSRPTLPMKSAPSQSRGIASTRINTAQMPGGQVNPFEQSLQKAPMQAEQTGSTTVIKNTDPEERRKREEAVLDMYAQQLAAKAAQRVVKKKWKPSYSKKSSVEVHVFGTGHPEAKKARLRLPSSKPKNNVKTRGPASIMSADIVPKPVVKQDVFESALIDQYKKQMRHSQEVNSLIDELKSVDMDYKKSY